MCTNTDKNTTVRTTKQLANMQSQDANSTQMAKLRSRTLDLLVIALMPILYGAGTRLPFIYFVIHLQNHFKFSWLKISFFLAFYQASRVITSALAIPYPKLSHFAGNTIGLAGYLTVYLFSEDMVLPFVVGSIVVGFSETMSSIQKYAKNMYKSNSKQKLRYQYAFLMGGVMGTYFIGGFVYQFYKIKGVALFGVIVQSTALFLFFTYLALAKGEYEEEAAAIFSNPSPSTICKTAFSTDDNLQIEFPVKSIDDDSIDPDCDFEPGLMNSQIINANIDFSTTSTPEEQEENKQPALPQRRFLSFVFEMPDSTNEKYYVSNEIPVSWINWLLCISFGIEALSYNLSIGPIFIVSEFQKDTGIIGLIFSIGSATGVTLAIAATCTSFGIKMMRKIARSPFDLCFALGGIGLGYFLANIPNFAGHVIGLILSLSFADLTAVVITELQASVTTVSNYSMVGPMGQVVRHSFNVVVALSGPVLFGISPRLPYFVAGSVTLAWATALFVAFRYRIDSTTEIISAKTGRNFMSVRERMQSFRGLEAIRGLMKHDSASLLLTSTESNGV